MKNCGKKYIIDDLLKLVYVVARLGNNHQIITGVSYENSLGEASLCWSCLGEFLKENNTSLHTPGNRCVRGFMKKPIHEGRIASCNQKFVSRSFNKVVNFLQKKYRYNLEISELFAKFFKHINAIKNFYEKKYESGFSLYRRIKKSKFEKCVDTK